MRGLKYTGGAEMDVTWVGRTIAYLLRHKEGFFDGHGWAAADAVIREIRRTYPAFDREALEEVVRTDRKGRYSFDSSGIYIRANQGHSIPVDLGLTPKEPPEVLYHGTASRFLSSILASGIHRMGRQYVHLSNTPETGSAVGGRHGRPAVLTVRTGDMYRDGYRFYLSENHVWLTDDVPPEYIEH